MANEKKRTQQERSAANGEFSADTIAAARIFSQLPETAKQEILQLLRELTKDTQTRENGGALSE